MVRSRSKLTAISVLSVTALLIVAGIATAMLVWPFHDDDANEIGSTLRGLPPTMVFSPAGTYLSAEEGGTGIAVHTFRVTPEYIAITYTVAALTGGAPASVSLRLVDDSGHVYSEKGNVTLGTVDGVMAGVFVVEPYVPGGSLLTLEVNEVRTERGSTENVGWVLPLLRTAEPDKLVSFIERGRLAPEEGVPLSGSYVGIAGPPGSSRMQVLVAGESQAASLFGVVEENGDARAVSRDEFRELIGTEGYPKPPAFPWPPETLGD